MRLLSVVFFKLHAGRRHKGYTAMLQAFSLGEFLCSSVFVTQGGVCVFPSEASSEQLFSRGHWS